jgi:predicted DCC family thiol-disulfide oxidoreductase YuxK
LTPATVIYDGDCGMCRDAIRLLRRWDRAGALRYVAFQDAASQGFGIPLPALAAALHLVLPDGRVFAGADAAPEIAKLLPGKRWLGYLYEVPGIRPLARRVYASLAARRKCAVR